MRVNSPENSGNQPQQPTNDDPGNLQGRGVSSEAPPGADRVPIPKMSAKQTNIPVKSFTAYEFIQALENNENFDNISIQIKGHY